MKGIKQMKISSAEHISAQRLLIRWEDGSENELDLKPVFESSQPLRHLLKSANFKNFKIDEYGWGLEWCDEVSIGSDSLLHDALVQAGELTSWETFDSWRKANGLSLTETAKALGISRRMVAYYSNREQAIPKMVGLAIEGLEARRAGEPTHIGPGARRGVFER